MNHGFGYLILFLFVFVLALLALTRVLRGWVSERSPIWRIVAAAHLGLQISAGALTILGVIVILPKRSDSVLWWIVLALAIVVGWSSRDMLIDMIAGLVLMFERRLRVGIWISGGGFEGTVESKGLRATWLRDEQGHRVSVPNRQLVGRPIAYQAGGATEHEVTLRLESEQDAARVRQDVYDAVLGSPWTLAGAAPTVLRDPSNAGVWRVRTKLLAPRFAGRFEGELLERVEELLSYEPTSTGIYPHLDERAEEEQS